MQFTETKLEGAYIIELERREDSRGFFARAFCQKEFAAQGLKPIIAQANVAYNFKKGALRDSTETSYQVGEFYAPDCESGLMHDDPRLGLQWPLPVAVISDKDQKFKLLDQIEPELRRRMTISMKPVGTKHS